MKECLKAGNLLDVAKVALQNVDSDMTFGMATKIGLKAMKGLDPEKFNSYLLPGYADLIQELSFWVPNEKEVIEMLQEVYKQPEPEVVETTETQTTEQTTQAQ